ncbi:Cyclin-dependent protein kinase inhibitor SMR13, partial [Cucurbita argyrosperma subsp. argyrosperma]
MASKGGRTRRGTNPTPPLKKTKKKLKNSTNNGGRRRRRRIIMSSKIREEIEEAAASSSSAMAAIDEQASSSDFEHCSTPKADRFKIPEIQICPPAPKKQRPISNCSLQKHSPIAFFASPDIELFFFFSQSN